MLIYSMGVSVDGYVADRDGRFDWSPPDEELFAVHTERVGGLGRYLLGRRLYEAMTVWETDPSLRENRAYAAFADIWTALPKVVFSRSEPRLIGNARSATGSVADEIAAAVETGRDVEIGGADLAGQAVALDLLDELRIFRYPVVVGGGTSYLPAVGSTLAFDLLESRTFASRVVYERYRRDRDGSTS